MVFRGMTIIIVAITFSVSSLQIQWITSIFFDENCRGHALGQYSVFATIKYKTGY